jgi:hypothetical protein
LVRGLIEQWTQPASLGEIALAVLVLWFALLAISAYGIARRWR